MSLFHPLWLLWVDVPLGALAGLLWWSVRHMDPVPPLVDIQNHPGVRRPITRQDWDPGVAWPVIAASATSAMAVVSLTARR